MKAKVSIVITCYNYGKYVEQCLESVLSQTFSDFEVIVVNDGSTDDSEDRIRPFLNDKRIKYIKQPNAGQANAKNRGIKESKGKFVAFLDADDYWEYDKLEKQLPLFENENVGVVYSRARYIDEKGQDLNKEVEEFGKYLKPRSGNVLEYLLFDNFVPFSSSVVRHDLLGSGFDEDLKMAIDWKLWLWLSLHWEFDYVDEKLLNYRIGHSNQMSKNAEERFKCTDMIMDDFLLKNGIRLRRTVVKKVLAHRYYLRWEYFKNIERKMANKYLSLAIKQEIQWKRLIKGLINSYLTVLPIHKRSNF